MRILLDTSAYSAFMRGHREVKLMLQQADEIVLTPIILGELCAGFLKGQKTNKNQAELRAFMSSPRVLTVDIDSETGDRYALILSALWKAGTPIPTNDIWIAASAMQHGLRIVTTDTHYRQVPQVAVEYLEP